MVGTVINIEFETVDGQKTSGRLRCIRNDIWRPKRKSEPTLLFSPNESQSGAIACRNIKDGKKLCEKLAKLERSCRDEPFD